MSKEPSMFEGFELLAMLKEPLVKLAWSKLSEAVRHAGAEILKNPREMSKAFRLAADALDRYADDKERKSSHHGG